MDALDGSWALRIAAGSAALLIGCGSDSPDGPSSSPPDGCDPGQWLLEDGTCWAAGLPADMPCPPGEWPRDEGTCVPAGVPPDGCAEGFVHDGDRGCDPILPAEPCAEGLMAIPGETACREVAPCGDGTWGDIAVEADTEHVDDSYPGIDSDGSPGKPWTTIQAGVDAAAAGAIVAIAEGSYLEDVLVDGKAVHLWGRCPALVEIVGTGENIGALRIYEGTDGTAVSDLAIRGSGVAVAASGSLDVVLDRVWAHDNAARAVLVQNDYGPTAVTLRRSLIERNPAVGVFASGSTVTIESSVVRDTKPGVAGTSAVVAQSDAEGAPATLSVVSSIVERNPETAIFVFASQATIDASIVRDTLAKTEGQDRGINVQSDLTGRSAATLLLTRSLLERNQAIGVFAASAEVTIEATVVRDTLPEADGDGRGLSVQQHPAMEIPSTLLLERSLIDRSREIGVFLAGSTATVEATAVRNTALDGQGEVSRGFSVQPHPASGEQSNLLLSHSLVEQSQELGVFVFASNATLEATAVRDTHSTPSGSFGRGIHVEVDADPSIPATLTMHASSIERSQEAGILLLGSSATLDGCLIRDTLPSGSGAAGDGLLVVSYYDQSIASVEVTSTHIDGSARAGLAALGAHASLRDSALSCHAFELDYETYDGVEPDLQDLGGNRCGCPDPAEACVAVTSGLEPPSALSPSMD